MHAPWHHSQARPLLLHSTPTTASVELLLTKCCLRSYRVGELPDVQSVRVSGMLAPLAQMADVDPSVAAEVVRSMAGALVEGAKGGQVDQQVKAEALCKYRLIRVAVQVCIVHLVAAAAAQFPYCTAGLLLVACHVDPHNLRPQGLYRLPVYDVCHTQKTNHVTHHPSAAALAGFHTAAHFCKWLPVCLNCRPS